MQKLGAGGRPTEEQVRIQVTGFERPSDPTGRVIKDTSNIPRARAIYQLIKARQGQAPAP